MTVSSNSWSLVSNKLRTYRQFRWWKAEIFGHAPLFLGIHAMISSISHKTQMWLCGMLISFSVHFFVSPIEWNILLSRPRRSLWKMTTWESGINGLVQCIFDKKECDVRNHKHLLLSPGPNGACRKKHYGRSYQKFHFFFHQCHRMNWGNPTFNQQ